MTKQKRVDIFFYFNKIHLKNITFTKEFRLCTKYFKALWQQLQPWVLVMTLQAWYTCIWGVSPILLCRSSQALSGWMGSVAAQLFSGLSKDVLLGSNPGSDWATQVHWDLSRSHSCVVFAVCLVPFSCWKVNLCPSLRSWALLSRFSSRISVHCFVHLSLDPD
jgi:hypothetical protein